MQNQTLVTLNRTLHVRGDADFHQVSAFVGKWVRNVLGKDEVEWEIHQIIGPKSIRFQKPPVLTFKKAAIVSQQELS